MMSTSQNSQPCTDGPLSGRGILIIVENLPVPFDRRVWQEARSLTQAGAHVSIICPIGKGFEARHEVIDGVQIYRHPLPLDASSLKGYIYEYSSALFWETRLAWKILFKHGFDAVHACNPPDLIFLVALPFKLIGKKFVFDHHDINPELYEAKFGRRGIFWNVLKLLERLTFAFADISIATNNSYKRIAIERGKMAEDKVAVVRSGPDLSRFKKIEPNIALRNGRLYLVTYVGVMGDQEGLDLLLESVVHIVKTLRRHDIQFHLVGGGPSLEGLKKLSDSLGVSDYVTFSGRVSDHDLLEALSTADVCVNPDRVNTMNSLSTMNKIIEYMAMEKPVVQYDVVEGRFSAGEASLYASANDPIDFARCIVMLLDDEDKRKHMGLVGRQRVVQDLSWSSSAPNLISAYRKLFERK